MTPYDPYEPRYNVGDMVKYLEKTCLVLQIGNDFGIPYYKMLVMNSSWTGQWFCRDIDNNSTRI